MLYVYSLTNLLLPRHVLGMVTRFLPSPGESSVCLGVEGSPPKEPGQDRNALMFTLLQVFKVPLPQGDASKIQDTGRQVMGKNSCD